MHQPAAGVAQHHKHEEHSKGCLPVLDQADRDAEHGAHDGPDEPISTPSAMKTSVMLRPEAPRVARILDLTPRGGWRNSARPDH
jgi:hypothetical protein